MAFSCCSSPGKSCFSSARCGQVWLPIGSPRGFASGSVPRAATQLAAAAAVRNVRLDITVIAPAFLTVNTITSMSTTPPPPLSRRFGLLHATALNMINMIGIGPFITIPLLMTALGGPQAMLGWIVALVIVICDGMVWSELGAAFAGSGGSFVYRREAYGRDTLGRLMAFLFVWQFILSGPLEIASGYIGFARYFQYIWTGLTPYGMAAVAAAVGAVNIALLYRRIGSIAKITVALWIGTIAATIAVMLTGAAHFDRRIAFDFPPPAFAPTRGFPHVSLVVLGLISIVTRVLPLDVVIDALLATRIVVQFVGQIGGVILLRRRAPGMVRPFRIWLYPLPVVVGLAGWLFIFA